MSRLPKVTVLLLALIIVMGVAAAGPLGSSPAAQAASAKAATSKGILPGIPNPCDLIPDGAARTICNGVTNPVGTASSLIGDIPGVPNPETVVSNVISDAATAVIQPLLAGIAADETQAVSWLLTEEIKYINNGTTPNTLDNWFSPQYALAFGMAFLIGLCLLIYRVIRAVIVTDPAEIAKGGFSFIAFFLAAGLLPNIVAALLSVCDGQITPLWMSTIGSSATNVVNNIGSGSGASVPSEVGEILVEALFLLAGIVGGVVLLVMLAMRYVAIFVYVIAGVFSFGLAPGGRVAGDRVIKTSMSLLGLILFKVILAVLISVGVAFIAGGSDFSGGSASSQIPGILLGSLLLIMVPGLAVLTYVAISRHQFNPHQAVSNPALWAGNLAYTHFRTAGD